MEKLINSIPVKRSEGLDKNGKAILSGFCLRFSVEKDKWVCGYGRGAHGKRAVEADDPVEALAFFVELLNKKT